MIKHKISGDMISASEARVKEKYIHILDPQLAIHTIFTDLDALTLDSQLAAIEAYFHVLYALELNSERQIIKEREKAKLKDLADKCLRFCHIQPVTSQHSHLYTRLYILLADNSLMAAQAWESVAQVMIGEYLGRDSKEGAQASPYLRGLQAWQLGHMRIAKIALHTMDIQKDEASARRQEALRLLIRIYRLSGEIDEGYARWLLFQNEYGADAACRQEIGLEKLLCELQNGADPKELYDFLNKNKNELKPFDLYLGQLWLCASRYRDIWVGLSNIKIRKEKKSDASSQTEQAAMLYLSSLEGLYNQEKPLQQRLESLGKRLIDIRSAPDPELAMLFLAGAIRWLNRSKQISFASILIDEYKALSLRYSEGKSNDTLGLIRDMIDFLPVVVDREAVKHQSHLYIGAAPRFLKIAQVVTKGAFLIAKLRLKKLSPEDLLNKKIQVHQEIINDLEAVIGELKGPVMKAAQLIAARYLGDDSTLQLMQGIYDSAPSLPFDIMKNQLEKELQGPILNSFKEFDSVSIAVTSISEVFRAKLFDETTVAVKVIYPHIEELMKSDLRLVKLMTPLLRQFKSQENLDKILEQFSQRFLRECDYEQEAATQGEIALAFHNDRDVRIPRIFPELSSRRILVTEYIEGTRLDHFIRDASQEDRNRVAAKLLRFGMLSSLKFGLMHIDPHLANYIVTEDKIAVLDFGAVATLPPALLDSFRKITVEKYRGNALRIYQELIHMKYIDPKKLSVEEFSSGFGLHMMIPYNVDAVRSFYEEGEGGAFLYLVRTGTLKSMNVNPQDFFPNAAAAISEEVLARLGAQLNWHRLLGEVLEELGLIEEQATNVS